MSPPLVRLAVNFAGRFEEFFGGTDIGANPTEEHGKYLVMKFDFSAVSKDVSEVQGSFDEYAALRVDTFAREYAHRLPEGLYETARVWYDNYKAKAVEQLDKYSADSTLHSTLYTLSFSCSTEANA